MVDKLVEEYGRNVDEAKLAGVTLFEHENECVCFYTVFIVLAVIALTVSIGIGAFLPINTSSVIKKMFLYMIMFIKQKIINHIKWEQ